jgi:hypothetical protein
MADKIKIETLVKLVGVMREEHEKLGAVIAEFDAILGGRATIGEKLKAFEDSYSAFWAERYGAPYVWNYAKDRAHLKRLLRSLDLGELAARAGSYLRNDDPFYTKTKHNFALFASSINSHAGAPKEINHFTDDVAATKKLLREARGE